MKKLKKLTPKPIVQISKFTSNKIIAKVFRPTTIGASGQDVIIKNLGTENFSYKCSCGTWHADVSRGTLPYCIHYLYVLAALIHQGLISETKSKLNNLDDEGFIHLGSLMGEIFSYETIMARALKGKILLCRECGTAPLKPVTIDKLTQTKLGFSIEGIGECPEDGTRQKFFRNIRVRFENLECFNCNKKSFKKSIKVDKIDDSYRFIVSVECKTRKCFWKKNFESNLLSASEIFARVKKLRITQHGIQIERDAGEGLLTALIYEPFNAPSHESEWHRYLKS